MRVHVRVVTTVHLQITSVAVAIDAEIFVFNVPEDCCSPFNSCSAGTDTGVIQKLCLSTLR